MPLSKKSPLARKADQLRKQASRARDLPFEEGGAKSMNAELQLRQLFIEGSRRHKKLV